MPARYICEDSLSWDMCAVTLARHRSARLLAQYDASGHIVQPQQLGRMTRFQRDRSVPGHAPAQSMNEADRSHVTKTGQIDQLATDRRRCSDDIGEPFPTPRLRGAKPASPSSSG
jgi:hypothetical protein